MGYTWIASNTKHTIRKSTYSYRNAAALIPNKNRYTTPLSLYYSPPNGIFSMLFLSLNSSLEYCFTLPDIRGMFIPGKKRIGLCRLPAWTLRSLEEHKKMLPDSYRLHGGWDRGTVLRRMALAAAASYRHHLGLADQRSHFLFADRHIDGNVHLFLRDE